MIALILLMMPAPPQAEAPVRGAATIVRGERIHMERPTVASDRQQRDTVLKDEKRTLRLIEFQ